MKEGPVSVLQEIPTNPTPVVQVSKSISIFRKRIQKFRRLKRGYYSFLVIVFAYALSFVLPLLINNKPLIVSYKGDWYFPLVRFYPAATFDQAAFGEADYRKLKQTFKEQN